MSAKWFTMSSDQQSKLFDKFMNAELLSEPVSDTNVQHEKPGCSDVP